MTVFDSVALNRLTVFEKSASDVDLMAVVVTETMNRKNVVDSIDVTDKDAIRQMFRKCTQQIWKMLIVQASWQLMWKSEVRKNLALKQPMKLKQP